MKFNKLKKTIFGENPNINIFESDGEASPSLHKRQFTDNQKMLR